MKQSRLSKSAINKSAGNTEPHLESILFLHVSLKTGGAEQLRYMLLKNIDKKKYNIKLCCIEKRGSVGKKIQQLGYQVDELGLNPKPYAFLTIYRLVKYFKSQNIDILQTCLFNANFHGRIAALICRIPYIITEEHSEHYYYNGIKHLPYILADFFLAKVTDKIVCCEKTLMKDIIKREKLPLKKVVAIENCIEPDLQKVTSSKEVIRKKYNIGDEFVFITVASLSPRKQHEILLNILGSIKKKGFSFKYFVAGNGPLKNKLQQMTLDLKINENVVFLGNVSNVTNYLNASDVFILPSLNEGLSIALMEAMFMKLPCIVSDVPGNHKLIEDGVNGFIVSPENEERLQDAIIFCLKIENKKLLEEFGIRSKKLIEEQCMFKENYIPKVYALWDKRPQN